MEIEKLATHIQGFDEITGGGIPQQRTTLLLGGPGSGKTIFAIQTLVNGARHDGEPGIFVALEEPAQQVRQNTSVFNWNAEALTDDNLFYFDAHLSPDVVAAGDFDLNGLLAMVGAQAKKMGATRIAFDGLDVLLSMLPDENAEKREIHRVREWLQENRLTGILTAKVESHAPLDGGRFSYLQYASDCVVLMANPLTERVSARSLRVLKYRGSGHSTNEFAVIISDSGLEVEGFTSAEMSHMPSDERIGTGVQGLDQMLQGGYYRGAAVLITGVSGTAKTTIAGAASYASCQRGEPALFISFEDAPDSMIRNFKTIGMDFSPFVKSGMMRFYSVRSTRFSTEHHVVNLKLLADRHKPKVLVVDPISALIKSSGHTEAEDAAIRVVDYAKENGITLVMTSVPQYGHRGTESTQMEISPMSDVWLHIAYNNVSTGRQREFTILKARGTAHSEQIKRLSISNGGICLENIATLSQSKS